MFVQLDAPQKKGAKSDEDIETILKQVEAILRHSPSGTGFAIHLVTAPAKDVLNLVSAMRELTPSLDKIKEQVPQAAEYKVITTPKLAFAGNNQMMIPATPGKN